MKHLCSLLILLITVQFSFAQTSTDIIVFDLVIDQNSNLQLSNELNITDRDGYDNQPCFSRDANRVYFTSFRDTLQSDIYRYDFIKNKTDQITASKASEFSPTLLKGERSFSTVRIEEDGSTQRLWEIDIRSRDAKVLMPSVKGIGYHSWINDKELALFIVGDPHSLHLAYLKKDYTKRIQENIGTAIHKVPGQNAFTFIDNSDTSNCLIKTYDIKTTNTKTECACLNDAVYFTYLKDGSILSGSGNTLYIKKPASKDWELVWTFDEDFNFYRIALSPENNKIAFVVYR